MVGWEDWERLQLIVFIGWLIFVLYKCRKPRT